MKKILNLFIAIILCVNFCIVSVSAAQIYTSTSQIANSIYKEYLKKRMFGEYLYKRNGALSDLDTRKKIREDIAHEIASRFWKIKHYNSALDDTGVGKMTEYNVYKVRSFRINCSTSEINNDYTIFKYDFSPIYYYDLKKAQYLDKVLKKTAKKLKCKTKYKTIKKIYKYVMKRISYSEKQSNVYYSYFNKKGNCTTYSFLFYILCRYAGIPCKTISSKDHCWNIVKIKGKWYHCDATWDDGSKKWDYFMRGKKDFKKHKKTEPVYRSSKFTKKFPTANKKYK